MRHLYGNLRDFVLHSGFAQNGSCLLYSEVDEHIVANFDNSIIDLYTPFAFDCSGINDRFDRKTEAVRIISEGDSYEMSTKG